MEPFHFLTHLPHALKQCKQSRVRAKTAKIKTQSRGFTLIEMIVVLAIIGILTAIILVGQTTFNRTLLLTDTAYTVALSVRETQTLGLSSEKINSFNYNGNAAFGIDFNAATPASYIQFIDVSPGTQMPPWCQALVGIPGTPDFKPGNCTYDGATELLHTYDFNEGFVQSFCAYSHLNGSLVTVGCSNSSTNQLQSLDIVFERPNTDTIITPVFTTNAYPIAKPDTACIEVTAPTGSNKFIEVTQLGEISVVNACT